jgi:hypothetical protein
MIFRLREGEYTEAAGRENARYIHENRRRLGGLEWARAMAKESAQAMRYYMKTASIVQGKPMFEYYHAYASEMQKLSEAT